MMDRGRTLWVGDIEPWMTEAYLAQCFGPTGMVTNLRIVRDRQGTLQKTAYAFVEFATARDASEFLDRLNGKPFVAYDGHRFRVNWATALSVTGPSNDVSLYVGNLDPTINDHHLFKLFSKKYNSVTSVKVMMESAVGPSRGFGFVRFRDPQEAEMALLEMQGLFVGCKAIKVRPAVRGLGVHHFHQTRAAGGYHHGHQGNGDAWIGDASLWSAPVSYQVTPPGYWILVSGLNPSLTEVELGRELQVFGGIYRVQLLEGAQGVAYVEFADFSEAERAVRELNASWTMSAQLLEGADAGMQGPAALVPAITNMTTTQAESSLHAQLKAQLQQALNAPPGLEHFQVLLQSPLFVQAFEAKLQRGSTNGMSNLPKRMLLEDLPELFGRMPHAESLNRELLRTFDDSRNGLPAVPGPRLFF